MPSLTVLFCREDLHISMISNCLKMSFKATVNWSLPTSPASSLAIPPLNFILQQGWFSCLCVLVHITPLSVRLFPSPSTPISNKNKNILYRYYTYYTPGTVLNISFNTQSTLTGMNYFKHTIKITYLLYTYS